jgi:hypothetical protein
MTFAAVGSNATFSPRWTRGGTMDLPGSSRDGRLRSPTSRYRYRTGHFIVGGHRPNPLPSGVCAKGSCQRRRLVSRKSKDVVRESIDKGVEIRRVDVAEGMTMWPSS